MAYPVKRSQRPKQLHKVRFMSRAMASPSSPQHTLPRSPTDTTENSSDNTDNISQIRPGVSPEELSSDTESAEEEIWQDEPASPVTMTTMYQIPILFSQQPPIHDLLATETSEKQGEVVETCASFLSAQSDEFSYYNEHGVPHLLREKHVNFCHKQLNPLPAPFTRADSARPWFFYWTLTALSALGEDVGQYRERLISTVKPLQNSTGGFGGGHGQMSHLATTYATVLSLAMVGGDDAINAIDRKAMWQWLSRLKQPDGGFQMSIGGEVDVRGAYCAAMLVKLLRLPLHLAKGSPAQAENFDLFTGLGEYVSRCQTYEGGIASRPDTEAHGAYAFCALACLCILGDPRETLPKYLDVPTLISWLSSRQYAPEGGFAGRTNKLVDGCYSHWIGGCWPLLDACLAGSAENHGAPHNDSLYSREALTRYILCCGQDTTKRGGLRDKPGMFSDGYHTCYLLVGLSSAQHKWSLQAPTDDSMASLGWTSETYPRKQDDGYAQIFNEEDRVKSIHPVYVIPEGIAERIMQYCDSQERFS
ncbi:CAAX farnesyltransferase (FTase) subunit beta [Pseudogymnoascus destructans]|uniref:Protein farnesyltransferase subunit beta n=2 Tax=Pseudogymnoascus destructans TaxID=655981 RepID=L8G6I5_PSED2|nr:CAAX farnesyltransferase (FTase) subunit beta [Pseudogymnoascus destructans]ELR08712.1 hypothetical protein GMDG_03394 [Pseudogymnoascus destructans 20631-21]OAF56236.1 CAAX farnesyltransferase (FTase) subunit beta [Pseudogymnoascus destructans]